MAPRHTPRKPRAGGDYGAIGTKGRKTGVTLPETDVRDEHGMEPIPSFSSPAKAPAKTNGAHHEDEANTATYTADETMDVVNSTLPEENDVIRTTKNARLSIPRSVSPKKGLMNGSPRRSVGRSVAPASSPSRELTNGTPSRVVEEPSVDASFEEPSKPAPLARPSPLVRPTRGRKPKGMPKKDKKKGPFDLSVSDDEDSHSANDTMDPSSITAAADEESLLNDEAIEQDTTLQSVEGEDPYLLPEEDKEEANVTAGAMPPPKPPTKARGGRPPKAPVQDPDVSTLSVSAEPKKKRGRPARNPQLPKEDEAEPEPEQETNGATDEKPPSKPKQTSKLKKSAALEVAEVQRRNKEVPRTESPDTKPKGKRKAPLTEQDPNRKMKAPRTTSKQTTARAGSAAPSFIQRSETPATEGAFTTQRGRTVIRPLAGWRGEKVIYGERRSRDSLPGILEVVRTEEVMPPPKKRSAGYRPAQKRGRQGTAQPMAQVEEEEDELEEWEAESGIQTAMVMEWSEQAGKYDENNSYVTEIAYAADAIEMRDIQGAEFKFAKTLTLPFFGSGMVHLPPGGQKRIKNSRRMQMVFFVFFGRVTVNVGTPTTTFSIGKGGQWMVPRGNFYSIINESPDRDARLFFAQGCQWDGEEEEGATQQAEAPPAG